jgi:hypothetical protein
MMQKMQLLGKEAKAKNFNVSLFADVIVVSTVAVLLAYYIN